MASADVSITVDDVTVDSSTTEEVKPDRPRVRFSDSEGVANSSKSNNNASEKSADGQPAPMTGLQPNGPSSDQAPPSPRRQRARRDVTPPLDERSLLLAATLVLDAKAGRNLSCREDLRSIRSYILYHKPYLRYLLYFFIFLNLSMAFFEKPSLPGAELPFWATMLMELACVTYFIMRKLHVLHFQGFSTFVKDTKNLMVVAIIVLTVLDMICYIVWTNVAPDKHPVRWSRPLRPLFIINFSDGKQIRRAFRNIRRTVPDIMHVLILFAFCVLLFALMGLKLFYRRSYLVYPNGEDYFKNYFDVIWDLYVLVTTANNPDVMMPAYDHDNWNVLYFIVYLVICLYIIMSIMLASIYFNYKKNLKNEIKTAVYSKRQKLAKAFDIIKVDHNGRGMVTLNRWVQLMGVVVPSKSAAQVDLLMKVLDINGDTFIYKAEFLNLADLLHVELTEVKDRQTTLEKYFPRMYNSSVSYFIKMIVKHKYFHFAFDFLIFVNAWFIGFDVNKAEWFFLVVFTLEILLKLFVYGPRQFAMRFWNIFDFLVIGSALIATIYEAFSEEQNEEVKTLDILLVLRVLRLFKLLGSIQRFKIVIQTIINIGPSIGTYGGVIFVFYYFFAIIGMEAFQNQISYHGYNESTQTAEQLWCGNPALQNSTFYRLHYCSNNFNNIVKAFVVLLELTVVNQWHVITSGFAYVSGTKWVRIYFFSFHLCCVVIVLNIFTAFILEAFILEYTLRTAPKLESAVEAKIKQLGLGIGMKPKKLGPPEVDELELVSQEEGPAHSEEPTEESDSDSDSLPDVSEETGLRFHLKKRTRKKTEVLLQQMFQSEIDADDVGPEELDEATEHKPRRRRLTLDEVA